MEERPFKGRVKSPPKANKGFQPRGCVHIPSSSYPDHPLHESCGRAPRTSLRKPPRRVSSIQPVSNHQSRHSQGHKKDGVLVAGKDGRAHPHRSDRQRAGGDDQWQKKRIMALCDLNTLRFHLRRQDRLELPGFLGESIEQVSGRQKGCEDSPTNGRTGVQSIEYEQNQTTRLVALSANTIFGSERSRFALLPVQARNLISCAAPTIRTRKLTLLRAPFTKIVGRCRYGHKLRPCESINPRQKSASESRKIALDIMY